MKTVEYKFQIYERDGQFYWHLCWPFSSEHGPFKSAELASDDLHCCNIRDELDAAAANETEESEMDEVALESVG